MKTGILAMTGLIAVVALTWVIAPRFSPDGIAPATPREPPSLPQDRPFTIGAITFPTQNPVFVAPDEPLAEDELYFVVEIPKGSPMKYETRTATGQLFLDRELCPRPVIENGEPVGWVHGYPAHYGFSSGQFNEDGDPIDLLVLGSDGKYEAMIHERNIKPQKVRVIGLLKMEECDLLADEGEACTEEGQWDQDWKVVAVDMDGDHSHLTDVHELPAEIIATLDHFFSHYKGPLPDSAGTLQQQTRVAGWMSKEETLDTFMPAFARVDLEARQQRVDDCLALFEERLSLAANLPPAPDYDKAFLGCLEEVHDSTFFESEGNFRFFVNYGAYQWLYKIAKGDLAKMEGVTLQNAVDIMHARREQKQEHYRLVSFDAPHPGLGVPIFEWIKTKHRNEGCPPDTPAQHYENRPLIDFDQLTFPTSD